MEPTVVAAIIGAIAVIAATLIPLLVKRKRTSDDSMIIPQNEGKLIRFTCESSEAENAKEVYIAGAFNDWLHADSGLIKPTSLEKERYGMIKQKKENEVVWTKEVLVPYGHHDFKFVVGRRQWVHWYRASGYPKGNDAPGGSNFRIVSNP